MDKNLGQNQPQDDLALTGMSSSTGTGSEPSRLRNAPDVETQAENFPAKKLEVGLPGRSVEMRDRNSIHKIESAHINEIAKSEFVQDQTDRAFYKLPALETQHENDPLYLVACVKRLEETIALLMQQISSQQTNKPEETETSMTKEVATASREEKNITEDEGPESEPRHRVGEEAKQADPGESCSMPHAKTPRKTGVKAKNEETSGEDNNSSYKDLTIYKEIKVRDSKFLGNTIFLKDEGNSNFLGKFSQRREGKQPITCRRVFSKRGIHRKTTLKVHSPILVEVLRESIAPCRNPYYERLYSPKVNIHKPYVLLFHNRQKLLEATNHTEEQKAALLRLLLDFLKEEMCGTWQKLDELEGCRLTQIKFEDTWLLYRPGTTIYSKQSGIWKAYKVEDVRVEHLPSMKSLEISCFYIDFDSTGSHLKPARETLLVSPFAGERLVSELEVVPESHLTDRSNILEYLRSRGKKFWEFHGKPAYRQYVGTAWPTTVLTDYVRVVIDYVTPSRHDTPYIRSKTSDKDNCGCPVCVKKYAGLTSYGDDVSTISRVCPKDPWNTIPIQQHSSQEDLEYVLIFCPSQAPAFSLKHKTWKLVEVEKLEPITCPKDPFEKLVLDEEYKLVVESMVESMTGTQSNSVSDIIKEKGRGQIILLHGGPGTGKTLTAECVAESRKRPLYMVTCGDLGTDPDVLEKRLGKIFLNAVNWKAVLLLDEADVFLQERDLNDLKRNALVSVFLRHIEYYDGILFLTTNRPGQIDEAFQSRIHITIGLPELDFKRQKQVWCIFINRLKFSTKEGSKEKKLELLKFVQNELESILESANYRMNGRQIRNCIRAATAIANKQNRFIQKTDIISVIELGTQFKDYMSKLNRMNQDEKARALGLRFVEPN